MLLALRLAWVRLLELALLLWPHPSLARVQLTALPRLLPLVMLFERRHGEPMSLRTSRRRFKLCR